MPYLVYWVPKNDYFPLEQRKEEIKFEITDSHSASTIQCFLTFKKDNRHLHLEFKPQFQDIENLSFPCIEANLEEGFFIFKIDSEIPSDLRKLLEEKIYHNFKELFHSHEHHGDDEDVILKGYFFEVEANTNTNNLKQASIKNLIELYRQKFKARNKELIDLMAEIKGMSLNENTLKLIEETLKNTLSTLGEKTYFNFLYNLAQNYNLNETFLRQSQFDIENLSQNLRIFLEYLKTEKDFYNRKLSDYQSDLSITATIYFSFAFFFTGLLVSESITLSISSAFISFIAWIFIKDELNKAFTKKFIPEEWIKKLENLKQIFRKGGFK